MKHKILTLTFSLVTAVAFGQNETANNDTTTQTNNDIEVGKIYISPLPVIGVNPAYGVFFGAAASVSMYMGEPGTTNMSNGMITATYSTKNQTMITAKANSYTNNNNYMLMTDLRLFFSSQPTYGLGTGPYTHLLEGTGTYYDFDRSTNNQMGELLNFNLVRVYQTVLRKIRPNMYAGIGYHLDVYMDINDTLTDLVSDPPSISNHNAYSVKYGFDPTGYTISGLSANWTYDSRDNVANPYSGRYAFASFRFNPEFLGSSQASTNLWLEYRDYFNLSSENPRNLIAVWTYANLTTSGKLPYMALPSIGWDQMGRSGRAFTQGRFRGDNMFYAEAEWRFPLPVIASRPNLFGGTVFANVNSASSLDNNVQLFDYLQPAAGIGLRVMLMEKTRTNLTLDYGWGANGDGAFYLNMNEYF